AVVAEILRDKQSSDRVSLDVNPTSREILQDLTRGGWILELIRSGARIHQSGCNGCIGMGQAPAVGRNSLRTMPRNFPGRSGTDEDSVWLCSPETAAAAALTGRITDPRDLDMAYPVPQLPTKYSINTDMLLEPLEESEARQVELVKGSTVKTPPPFVPRPQTIDLPVQLKVGDNSCTRDIMPAGSRLLPFRSNLPQIAEFVYVQVVDAFPSRPEQNAGGHAIVGGDNYA